MSDTTKADNAESQAKAQYESIREMIAALECDYDRLEDMRDERAFLEGDDEEATAKLRIEWDADNGEELKELEEAAGDCEDADKARQRIEEDALSVEVRSGWTSPGAPLEAEEFCILLCTGGPACRIVGDLSRGEPVSARLEYQDWGTPWTEYFQVERETLLTYARCFCFES